MIDKKKKNRPGNIREGERCIMYTFYFGRIT